MEIIFVFILHEENNSILEQQFDQTTAPTAHTHERTAQRGISSTWEKDNVEYVELNQVKTCQNHKIDASIIRPSIVVRSEDKKRGPNYFTCNINHWAIKNENYKRI